MSGSSLHEGSSINSVIGNINVSGDPNLSYSLEGDQNEDFIVSSDGKIKVRNSLDFEIRDSYQLTLHVNGQNDSVSIPLNINLAKNIDPDFKTICNNSCEFQENTKIGTVVISSLRIDEDTDSLSYSLENNYQDKFSIVSRQER